MVPFNKETTIYGQKWLMMAVDEIHNARRINRTYRALLPLAQQTRFVVAMTATPITTSPLVSVNDDSPPQSMPTKTAVGHL